MDPIFGGLSYLNSRVKFDSVSHAWDDSPSRIRGESCSSDLESAFLANHYIPVRSPGHFFLEFGEERQGPLENRTERDENSLKGGRSGGVFDFQPKRDEIVKKKRSERHRQKGKGRRRRECSVIASAPIEPWHIAEYFFRVSYSLFGSNTLPASHVVRQSFFGSSCLI